MWSIKVSIMDKLILTKDEEGCGLYYQSYSLIYFENSLFYRMPSAEAFCIAFERVFTLSLNKTEEI